MKKLLSLVLISSTLAASPHHDTAFVQCLLQEYGPEIAKIFKDDVQHKNLAEEIDPLAHFMLNTKDPEHRTIGEEQVATTAWQALAPKVIKLLRLQMELVRKNESSLPENIVTHFIIERREDLALFRQ